MTEAGYDPESERLRCVLGSPTACATWAKLATTDKETFVRVEQRRCELERGCPARTEQIYAPERYVHPMFLAESDCALRKLEVCQRLILWHLGDSKEENWPETRRRPGYGRWLAGHVCETGLGSACVRLEKAIRGAEAGASSATPREARALAAGCRYSRQKVVGYKGAESVCANYPSTDEGRADR